MSNPELDSRELLMVSLGQVLGLPGPETTIPVPALLSRRWTVFQVPSATTPNYSHLVVGTIRGGWRCSCVGWQSHGKCYHVQAVMGALKMIANERKAKPGSATPKPNTRRRIKHKADR